MIAGKLQSNMILIPSRVYVWDGESNGVLQEESSILKENDYDIGKNVQEKLFSCG